MVDYKYRLRKAVDSALLRHQVRQGVPPLQAHTSHIRFVIRCETVSRDDNAPTPCLVEPTVPCTHCGYCVSFGH